VRAIYWLIEEVKRRYPDVIVEAHDPIWSWTVRYLPTYWRQGGAHGYDENWGFEFMWNPIEDLRSGRAICLYYYNLAYNIPLYDHITMEADNDNALSFWWYASTVRHLGIGGKKGLGGESENERRFEIYREAMARYNRLREYFVRGEFVGIDELAHLHVHPDGGSGVLVAFNLEEKPQARQVRIPASWLGSAAGELRVVGAAARADGEDLVLDLELGPLAPLVVEIGVDTR
jgi:hypothetical protein